MKGVREKVQLATKFGIRSHVDGNLEACGDPAYVREACEGSLKRLQVECIDLYYQHRIDTKVPIEVTVSVYSSPCVDLTLSAFMALILTFLPLDCVLIVMGLHLNLRHLDLLEKSELI